MPVKVFLALPTTLTYPVWVSILRTFVLICACISLFVQASAQAAADPQAGSARTADCTEMMQEMTSDMRSKVDRSDEQALCRDMGLGCVLAMNCISPLVLSDTPVAQESAPLAGFIYTVGAFERLKGQAILPEFPPPKISLAV